MAKNGLDFHEFQKFADSIAQINEQQKEQFLQSCAKELAARLLAKVIKRTPVGQYGKEKMVERKIYDYWQEDGTDDRAGKKHRYDTGKTKMVKVRTSKKTGGTLRRGWTAGSNQNAVSYANSLDVRHVGNTYIIDVINPVEYASYVEYGHRTKNHTGWVSGQFMLTISEEEIRQSSDSILQAKLNKFLRSVMDNA